MATNASRSEDTPFKTTVSFCAQVYSLDVVKKAAYRMLGHCAVDISAEGEWIHCALLCDPSDQENTEKLKAQLTKEVLDQDLRRIVAAETEPLRNAILGFAFSRTSLQEEP